ILPGKTWSGFFGALLGGAAAAALVGFMFGLPSLIPVVVLGCVIAAIAQLGDLFESHLKRQAGVKDSGQVIPGHGGILDRVDGLIAAALLAFVIGGLRGGIDNTATGLLFW